MKVMAKAYIRHNNKLYKVGDELDIEDKHYERIKDIVEVVEIKKKATKK